LVRIIAFASAFIVTAYAPVFDNETHTHTDRDRDREREREREREPEPSPQTNLEAAVVVE
jgi:hypothetical protein